MWNSGLIMIFHPTVKYEIHIFFFLLLVAVLGPSSVTRHATMGLMCFMYPRIGASVFTINTWQRSQRVNAGLAHSDNRWQWLTAQIWFMFYVWFITSIILSEKTNHLWSEGWFCIDSEVCAISPYPGATKGKKWQTVERLAIRGVWGEKPLSVWAYELRYYYYYYYYRYLKVLRIENLTLSNLHINRYN